LKNFSTKHFPIILLAFIFVLTSFIFFRMAVVSTTLSEIIMFWISGYFLFYLFLVIFTSKIKSQIIKYIMNVLGFPLLIVFATQYYLAPIITILLFLGFYIVPTSLILELSNLNSNITPILGGIIYLVNVFAVLIFAYFGNKVMLIIIDTFKTKFKKDLLDKYSTVLYTRIYTYVLMIIIYIIFNFISFSKENILSFLPVEPVSVIKEVFVTFVAIDTLIQIFLNKKQER